MRLASEPGKYLSDPLVPVPFVSRSAIRYEKRRGIFRSLFRFLLAVFV